MSVLRRKPLPKDSWSKWLSAILEQEQKEREEKMLGLWMACYTQEYVAEQVGITKQAVSQFLQKSQESFQGKDALLFRDFESDDSTLKVYSVWNFACYTQEAIAEQVGLERVRPATTTQKPFLEKKTLRNVTPRRKNGQRSRWTRRWPQLTLPPLL